MRHGPTEIRQVLRRPSAKPRVGGDPVDLPRGAAIGGERLLETAVVRIENVDDEAHQDRLAREGVGAVEDAALAAVEAAAHGHVERSAVHARVVQGPAPALRVEQAQGHAFDAAERAGDVELHEIRATTQQRKDDAGARVLAPLLRTAQRLQKPSYRGAPAAVLEIEIVRRADRRLIDRAGRTIAGTRLQRGICAGCDACNDHDDGGDAHGAKSKDRRHGNDCSQRDRDGQEGTCR